MTITLGLLRALLMNYVINAYACPYCFAEPGDECVTRSGTHCVPHLARRELLSESDEW